MAELAFNVNGERFEAPADAEYWRVRRFKPSGRGTPEVVFGRDGLPLLAPIDADIHEFRRLVEAHPGRYRLDPIDAEHKACDDATAAYVQLADTGEAASGPAAYGRQDDLIRELMRVNADMVKNITDKFASVMDSAATLIRAADGAGLPARPPMALAAVPAEPLEPSGDDDDDEDDDDDTEPRNAAIGGLLAQVMPLIQMAVAQRMGNQAGAAGQRNAAPTHEPEEDDANEGDESDEGDDASVDTAASPTVAEPPGPEAMAHFLAIQQALTPTEARLAQAVAAQLPPAEINGWIAQLSALSVDDAVALVRETIARGGKGGAA